MYLLPSSKKSLFTFVKCSTSRCIAFHKGAFRKGLMYSCTLLVHFTCAHALYFALYLVVDMVTFSTSGFAVEMLLEVSSCCDECVINCLLQEGEHTFELKQVGCSSSFPIYWKNYIEHLSVNLQHALSTITIAMHTL